MFDNTGNLRFSAKIANTMTSAGRKISVPTVESYLDAHADSFILYKIGRYDIKGKQYLATGAKYYVVGMGSRYYLLGTKTGDMRRILENIVYLELRRKGYEVHVGRIGETEVDFAAVGTERRKLTLPLRGRREGYYQVSQSVMSEETLRRELASLETVRAHNPKFMLAMDYTPMISHNGIRQINVINWLLKDRHPN